MAIEDEQHVEQSMPPTFIPCQSHLGGGGGSVGVCCNFLEDSAAGLLWSPAFVSRQRADGG